MAIINLFGDFKVGNCSNLELKDGLAKKLGSADLNVVNFEAPVSSNGKPIKKSGPNICQDACSPEWLEKYGFNAVSFANNHMMDFGREGLETSRNQFKSAIIMGAGTWEDAYKLHTFHTEDGLRIGIICCTHCEFGTLTDKETDSFGCAWALSNEIIRLISEGKSTVDFLIVYQHGGIEYMDQPLPEWREQYKFWIDMGADAVIASHPHVPQGWEFYKEKPICYSLGNFCFNQLKNNVKTPAFWYESLCCSLKIEVPHRCQMDILPLVFDPKSKYIRENNDKEFLRHLDNINDVLHNEDIYIGFVKESLKNKLTFYYGQFSRGGMVINPFSTGFIKGLVDGFMGRGFFGRHHAINNIRCESHRWAILRAIENNF